MSRNASAMIVIVDSLIIVHLIKLQNMPKVKVMLASRPKLLSEVIRNLIEHQQDMTVVGEVLDPLQLLLALKQSPVDIVIITPLSTNGEPKLCHLLLTEYPKLIILTQSAKGEAVYMYHSGGTRERINQSSGQSIINAIRLALRPVSVK